LAAALFPYSSQIRCIRLLGFAPTVFLSIIPFISFPFYIKTTLSLTVNSTVSIESSLSSKVLLNKLKLISGIINESIYFPVHNYLGLRIAGIGI